MVLVWALWSYLCRWWKIYGHIWQSRCTNCFLALSNERFFYLCVEEGRFLDTDLFQLDNFFHSINMLDLHCGFWLFCCYAIGYLSSSTSSVIFLIAFASLCLFFMYFMLEDGNRHSLPGTRFASPLNYLLWCFCDAVHFSGFDFPILHKKWSFPVVVINSFFSRSSPQFFRAEACNFIKKQTLAQVFKFYKISKDTYS